MSDSVRRRTALEIPWATILKLLIAIALAWVFLQLTQLILVVIVAILLAVTLNPVVTRLQRRGLGRGLATAVVCLVVVGILIGFFWMTWNTLSDQARYLSAHADDIQSNVASQLPSWIGSELRPQNLSLRSIGPYLTSIAESAMRAVVVALLGFVLTLYLLIEGRRTLDWLQAFVPRAYRGKTADTLADVETVIFAYVAGNIVTSIFATIFVLIALSILRVPAALLLAILAGLCDFIPVLGFILSVVPALALALTVSVKTMLVVVSLYVGYHFAENYYIGPRVYGNQLQLSNVAVILAFAVGAELAGVIGALIALPVAAAYPAIERIWLRDRLADDTLQRHRALGKKAS